MVGHAALRPDLHLPVPTPLPEESQVGLIVLDAEERVLPAVPALRDMVWDSRCDYPRDARHDGSLCFSARQIKN